MTNITYVLLRVAHREREVAQTYVLGELAAVYREPVVIGRAPSCDVIIDDRRVPAFALELFARGRHQYARLLPHGEADRSGAPVRIGPYELSVWYVEAPHDHLEPAADLPVRFGSRRKLAQIPPSDIPVDPRAEAAGRLAAALEAGTDHVTTLDAATERWCAAEVHAYAAALSEVTRPWPAIAIHRIEYATARTGALERWTRAWRAVETRPFDPGVWAQIHRFDMWHGRERERRFADFAYAESFASRLHWILRGSEPSAERACLAAAMYSLLAAHLATLDAAVSPARPLAALVARGVFPLAVPDGMLLYLAACDGAVLHSSVPGEAVFLHALAAAPDDRATRLVYADYLEQYGHASRADAVRDAPLPPRRLASPSTMFPGASPIAPWREGNDPPFPRLTRSPPGVHLIEPLAAAVRWFAGAGAIWIAVHATDAIVRLNEQRLFSVDGIRPVLDGDVLDIERAGLRQTATVHCERAAEAAA